MSVFCFSVRFWFLVLCTSVFGFGFGFHPKPNRSTEKTEMFTNPEFQQSRSLGPSKVTSSPQAHRAPYPLHSAPDGRRPQAAPNPNPHSSTPRSPTQRTAALRQAAAPPSRPPLHASTAPPSNGHRRQPGRSTAQPQKAAMGSRAD
jgi:hypothetical protein